MTKSSTRRLTRHRLGNFSEYGCASSVAPTREARTRGTGRVVQQWQCFGLGKREKTGRIMGKSGRMNNNGDEIEIGVSGWRVAALWVKRRSQSSRTIELLPRLRQRAR